jgi:hypothetical protein
MQQAKHSNKSSAMATETDATEKIGVANGTRTRNNKLHKLGLYH